MRYFTTSIKEQESTINILYDEQLIRIYTNRIEVIKDLTEKIGNPTKRYFKTKSSWSGASWDVEFSNVELIKRILNKDIFIDVDFKQKEKNKKKLKNEYGQLSLL